MSSSFVAAAPTAKLTVGYVSAELIDMPSGKVTVA
jgi:hypothetical protein